MASPKYDLFISHNWGMDTVNRDNHKRVARLNKALVAANLSTWFDENQLKGNINQSMASGIDNSRKVLVCITKRYMDKVAGKMGSDDNCRKEFDYSAMRKGLEHIIPVVMEKECLDLTQWHGPIGLSLANQLYINFTDNSQLSSCVRDIAKNISIGDDTTIITNEEGTYRGEVNKGGLPHGFGTMKYANKNYYEGSWKKGKKHGTNGKLEYYQKGGDTPMAVYEGSFYGDQKHGTGKLTMRNGDIYEGGYIKNHKEGKGKFVAKDKSEIYEGDYKQGNRHGIGQRIDKAGQVYIGEFRVNKIFGKGKMKYKDGRVYNGEWVDGKRVGRGEMWDINNNRYNGEWIANRRSGQGSLHYKSGDIYAGSFKNGMIDGKGVTNYKNGAEYDGEYRKNKKHGQGKYTFSDGHQFYSGEWKTNKRHGNGVRLYKNGDIYEGAFVNNMREGQGTIMIKETGIVYQGTWLADAMHGSGFCVVENNDSVKVRKSRFGFFSDKKVKQVKVEFDNNSLTSSKRVKEKRRWRRKKSDNDSEIVSLPDNLLSVKSQEDQMSFISQEV
uniref:TIR domain-containing protein n=1 Tax=Chaetoceros debilis TaxID=122233 RepID=A0A7S3PYN2_9STRA|mmetsp:Transcript_8359/g.11869  ORF Transcript_8359/g.11869 Transcript_8359/m.11869 type:complete len:553 (+) Transcript_8359:150-1808(+)|eukprot:CAMPEP_0194087506 /NCGR_PEP_ID=MMETSP0149-20130528/25328_1 /TAXON_ID=122233 /ORGANISM="Chaetoceros debilis, Strain MM31A-1" /LENGTH=552 /DNA_ID=CAMNT_0038770871 /DNA_START=73 /DNA_END=1731 /DNA_ORIENTATION=-